MKASYNKKSIDKEDELFMLIKSLGKSEKRHFKIFSERHVIREQNNYISLFNFLEKQNFYDEERIKKHFPGQKFVQNLEVSKNYLYKMIMQALRSYHHKAHPMDEVAALVKDVEILFGKGLIKRANKVLLKAKEKAEQYNFYPKLIDIINLEYRIGSRQGSLTQIDQLQERVFAAKEKVIELLNNTNEYNKLYFRFSQVVRHTNVIRDKKQIQLLNQIMSHPLLSTEKNALSFHAKLMFLDMWGIYYSMIGDHINSFKYGKRLVAIIESFPHMIHVKPEMYLSALNNSVVFCLRLKRFNDAKKMIEQMKSFQHSSPAVQAEVFEHAHDLQLSYYQMTGEFKKGADLIPFIEKGIEKYKNNIQLASRVNRTIHFSCIYLGAGNYKKALYWINILLNEPETSLRDDVLCCTRIMNLIVHFELGNKLVLPYTLRSTYRFFRKRNVKYEFETVFLKNIRKLVNANTSKELKEVYKKIHTQLLQFSKSQFEEGAFEIFDLLSWVESKIETRSFAEVVKEKAKLALRT